MINFFRINCTFPYQINNLYFNLKQQLMKRSILIIFTILFSVSPLLAQIGTTGGGGSMNRNDNEEIMNQYMKGMVKNETPTNVKGSPYLNSDFQRAQLVFPENQPLDAAIRYDVAKEEMQVELEEGSFRVLHPGVVVKIDNRPFKMMSYKGDNKTFDLLGYFEILTPDTDSNDLMLLKKYKKDVRRGKAAAAMQKATPPRYIDKDYYYLKFGESKPVLVERRRSKFLNAFPEAHQDAVKKYMKENNLKSKDENDLLSLVNYYNSTF